MKKTNIQSKSILHRERVNQLYCEAENSNIISIVAGPGYGKTQSVMNFLSEQEAPIIWVPFSRLDNYTAHFWENFCNAFHTVDEAFSDHCLKLGFPNDAGTMYRFLKKLLSAVEHTDPFYFVFDDCHLIEENAVCIFIHNLLKAISNYATVFFISRTINYLNAPHNIQGVSAKMIDESILAFSATETMEYFRLMDISVPPNLLHSIHKKTEGWPVAVCLFAMYGRENPAVIITSPKLTDDILQTLIEREIFSQCTMEDQRILLKLSLLDFLPARYVEETYGKQALTHIASSLLVRFNAHSNSYSLHQLLKDYLKQRADSLGEHEIRSTYEVAAKWFMKYDLKIDALHCYEHLRDEQNLWNIVWNTLTDSKGPTRELLDYCHKILNRLTQSTSFHDARLPLAKAIYYTFTATFHLAEKEFHQVIHDCSTPVIQPGTGKIIGEAHLNIALIRMLYGDVGFRTHFQQAQKFLPNGSITQTSGRMIVLNGDTVILNSGEAGELEQWIQAHRENSKTANFLLHNTMCGMDDMVTAQAHYYRGDMIHAEQFALTTLTCAKEQHCVDIVGNAYYLLEKISMYQGDYAKVRKYIADSYAYMEIHNENPHYNLPEIAEGYFFVQIEKGELMKDWITNESTYYKSLLSTNYGQERLLKGQYLLKKEQYSELFAHLDYTKKVYEQSHRYIALIYTHLLYAFSYYKIGNLQQAVWSFETAYRMAVKNHIIMPFIEMSQYTRTICSLVRSESRIVTEEWLDMIQTKATTYRKRILLLKNEYQKEHADGPVYSLTSREKQLLFLLGQGLTRNEAAEEIHISINTVKSIQKAVYEKLGAFNSAHAMYIAVKNGLIE